MGLNANMASMLKCMCTGRPAGSRSLSCGAVTPKEIEPPKEIEIQTCLPVYFFIGWCDIKIVSINLYSLNGGPLCKALSLRISFEYIEEDCVIVTWNPWHKEHRSLNWLCSQPGCRNLRNIICNEIQKEGIVKPDGLSWMMETYGLGGM